MIARPDGKAPGWYPDARNDCAPALLVIPMDHWKHRVNAMCGAIKLTSHPLRVCRQKHQGPFHRAIYELIGEIWPAEGKTKRLFQGDQKYGPLGAGLLV